MRNNKGFSLVELIIVIAIMAILVGVMAPQLIKYIEKTNVSSDTQLCDSVKTAMTTAMMDPAVIADPDATIPDNSTFEAVSSLTADDAYTVAVEEILGLEVANIDDEIKSTCDGDAGEVQFAIVSANAIHVQIENSDSTGNKGNGDDGWDLPIYVD